MSKSRRRKRKRPARQPTVEQGWPYAPELYGLMDQAVWLQQDGNHQGAEGLYTQLLARDPAIKEAYNNLAAIHEARGDLPRAREMLQHALELDPLYPFPRCSLALLSLAAQDVPAAWQWIAPLAGQSDFGPQEMVLYQYVQARILVAEQRYEEAEPFLEEALRIDPDYQPALDLLPAVLAGPAFLALSDAISGLIEEGRQSHRRHRERTRSRITMPDATLEQVLTAYTKDSLAGIAGTVLAGDRWRSWPKAELIAGLRQALLERGNLARIVAGLSVKERQALRAVLDGGGMMPGPAFRQRYGDDAEESLRWQYQRPASVLGRLRAAGLLAEGLVGAEERVLVPVELRPLLREVLGDTGTGR